MKRWYNFVLIWLLVGFTLNCQAQEVLLLEVKNQVEAYRYVPGDVLIYRAKESKEWQQRTIIRFIPESNLIIFDDGMVNLNEIGYVQRHNYIAKGAGKLLAGFGGAWLLFGGILGVAGKEDFTWTTLAIGAAGIGLGQLFIHVAGKRNYKMDKYNRLRLIDITMRMSAPETQFQSP